KTKTIEETIEFAKNLGNKLFPGAVITLEGDLGAGKTTFTKGIAQALHVNKTVNSPTFTIIKEYVGDLNLYHMDVYRLSDHLEDLGFDEYFYGEGVCVIEWASIIEDQIPRERLHINIFVQGEFERLIELVPNGTKYQKLCEVLFNE
ncbi:MAG: tRNA ((37)-N6)-threonylcarbamoyltransferase complex ATPase subunit type 1 TsaE, partial [Haloplasmataceae bacterium]|nr:tRNA ((37)-N6)-threonylcarbamoyltransferase complex ATPase subunit type 1 TsaE [Haloplasmataceae bacterium]